MDIAAMSMSLANSRLQMEIGTSIAKKVMDSAEINAEGLNKMIESLEEITPSSDCIIDVRA